MDKRKIQAVLFYSDAKGIKHFLLLKVNEKRGLFWQNVTGGVDKEEKYIDAAVREAQEETALKIKNIHEIVNTGIRFRFRDRWGKDVTEKVFLIHCKKPWDVIIDPSEHCDHKWVEERDIDKSSVEYASNVVALESALGHRC